MPATQTTNLGLNKPDRQDLVSVVTDINDNMDTLDGAIGALPTGRTLQGQINTLKPIDITLDPVTNANGAVTVTTTDARITEDLKAICIEVGTPETFKAPVKITTGNGTVELYCANAVGSSTVVVTFEMATPLDSADPQPASVTSTEFDILAGRIGTLSQLTTTNKQDIVSAVNELDGDIATLSGKLVKIIESQYTLTAGSDFVYQSVGTNRTLISAYVNGWDSDGMMVKGFCLLNASQYGIFFNKSLGSNKTLKVRTVWMTSTDVEINY